MNSILQALLGLKPFADDLKDKDILEKLPKDRKFSLYRSLCNLLIAKEKGAQPQVRRDALHSVKSSLDSTVQRYRGWRQQDAHEFLCLLLNLLDSEIAEVSELEKTSAEQKDSLPDPKQSQRLHSPVTLNFECNTRTTLTCQGCGRKHDLDEVFVTFPVSLPNSSVLSVQYMFNAFFEDYEVNHSCRCGHVKGTLSRCIVSLPRVLVIYLKRYKLVGDAYVKRTDRVRVPSNLALGHLCDAEVELPHVFECKESSRPERQDSSSPAPSSSKSVAYLKSPATDSTYGSNGKAPFMKETTSVSGEKRKRRDSGDSGVEVMDTRDETRPAQKRLCLDGKNIEETVKQLTESKFVEESLPPFNISDDDDDDLAEALSLSVAETKKDESDLSKAIAESLKEEIKCQEAEKTELEKAVALSLMENQPKKPYSEMTEEEQLRHALALSLKGS
jgi:ubiquitin carboxyl-terminal hydrolase 26/29/37